MKLGQGMIVGFIHKTHRSSSSYSEDQSLQCYWSASKKGYFHPGHTSPSDL